MKELKELLQHPVLQANMTAQNYIQIDSTKVTLKSLTDEEILKMLHFGDDEDRDSNEDDDEASVDIPPKVTSPTVRDCVKALHAYFEQKANEFEKSVSALKNLLCRVKEDLFNATYVIKDFPFCLKKS